jgi:hypothetical protein
VPLEKDRASFLVGRRERRRLSFLFGLIACDPRPMRLARPCCEHEEVTNSCGVLGRVRCDTHRLNSVG